MAQMFSSMRELTRLSFYLSREQLPKVNRSQVPTMAQVTALYVEIFNIDAEPFHYWIDPLFPNLKELTVKTNIDRNDAKFPILEDQLRDRFRRLDKFKLKY